MRGRYLGDSYDLVKRVWAKSFRSIGPLYAHPKFILPGIRDQFTTVTLIPILESTAPPKGRYGRAGADLFFKVCDSSHRLRPRAADLQNRAALHLLYSFLRDVTCSESGRSWLSSILLPSGSLMKYSRVLSA